MTPLSACFFCIVFLTLVNALTDKKVYFHIFHFLIRICYVNFPALLYIYFKYFIYIKSIVYCEIKNFLLVIGVKLSV
jgi:hypothetical protein